MVTVLFVGSSGGHLAQMFAMRDWWQGHERAWATFDTPDAQGLLELERTWWVHHPTTRNLPNAVRNLGLAVRVLLSYRPDVVVSTGAACALPFFVVARALGIPTLYVEVYDRLDSATLTARLCRPFTTRMCVQWPEQLEVYPRATLVGTLL